MNYIEKNLLISANQLGQVKLQEYTPADFERCQVAEVL